MSWNFRSFSLLGELNNLNKVRFSDFEKLNDFLERNPLLWYTDLYNSYVKVVLDLWSIPNYTNYNELDFQLRYLIDDIKIPLNRILDYAKCKFPWVIEVAKDFFLSIPWCTESYAQELIEGLEIFKKWNILISVFVNGFIDPDLFSIPFDISLPPNVLNKRLRETIKLIRLDRIEEWEIEWIGISITE